MGRSETVVRSSRLLDRRRAVRRASRQRRLRATLAVVLLIGLAGGAWVLTRSPVFGLSRIDVVGAVRVTRQAIIDASGVRPGQNAMAIDLGAVTARVRAVPGVADARVERSGSLSLRIVIIEQRAVALVRSAGRRWYVDQSGRPVTVAGGRGVVPVIVFDGQRRALIDEGVSVAGAVRTVLDMLDRFPADLRARVRSFGPRLDGTVIVRLDAFQVNFGMPVAIDQKIVALGLVEGQVRRDGQRVRVIDVSAPDHPVARVR